MSEQLATPVVSATRATTEKISAEVDNAIQSVRNISNNSSILFGLAAVVIISIICAVLMYYMIVESIFNKRGVIVEKTKYPRKGYIEQSFDIKSMPKNKNGTRRSMTFWIYVNDLNNAPGQYKHVFSVGSQKSSVPISNSPIVFLDNTDNKLHIRFSHKDDNAENNFFESSRTMPELMQSGVTIDYLPMQRWVHVAMVVTDGVNGGTVDTYLDAELAKSVTHGDIVDGLPKKLDDELNLDKGGYLIIGGNNSVEGSAGFNGLVSKVTFYNHDLNNRDIYNIYDDGPIDGMLATLGYGVRSPIYKLADD